MSRQRIRDLVLFLLLSTVVYLFYSANSRYSPSSEIDRERASTVDSVILRISAPLERAFVVGFDAWIGVWQQYLYRLDLKDENERLAEENAELEANNRILAAMAQRGRELARFRAYMTDSAAELRPANVVRRKIDTEKFRVVGIVIDRRWGEVRCGKAVVTPQGVVGRILGFELPGGDRIPCPVEQNLRKRRYRGKRKLIGRAMVRLTVDPQSLTDVRIPRTGARGTLKGSGWDKGFVGRLIDLDVKAKVAVGDLVVTTGVEGSFPAGLPVGRVLSVSRRPGEEPVVLVKPPMDYGKITRALVVASTPPPAVPRIRRGFQARTGLRPYP